MRRARHAASVTVALACALTILGGRAWGANCAVKPGGLALIADVPSAGLNALIPASDALVIPIDIDAAAGKFTIRRETLPEINIGTQGGIARLKLGGDAIEGTIDRAGNVFVPNMPLETVFLQIPLDITITLSTLDQAEAIFGVEYPHSGKALDFTTGILTLEGIALLPNAPIVESPVVTGLHLTCTLDTIPSAKALPAPPRIKRLTGKVEPGGDQGDTLTLTTAFTWRGPDLGKQDVFVTITGASQPTVKLLAVADEQGQADRPVSVLDGFKHADPSVTPVSGTMSVRGRRTVMLRASVPGMNLSQLAGPLRVVITAGAHAAVVNATVTSKGRLKRTR